MMRIWLAARLSAISSSRRLICAIRMPSLGTISYNVTVGPTVAFMLSIVILWSAKAFSMRSLLCCNSLGSADMRCGMSLSSSRVGKLYPGRIARWSEYTPEPEVPAMALPSSILSTCGVSMVNMVSSVSGCAGSGSMLKPSSVAVFGSSMVAVVF